MLSRASDKGEVVKLNLIYTIDEFNNCLNTKGQVDAILLDFSKAYDKVDHKGLILKLKSLGINNNLSQWIESFLLNREQTVIVDGKRSSPIPVLSGVPQGTVLGPLFFLIYINDITNDLTKGTSLRLFADDSLLYRKINTIEDTKLLQKDLNTLQEWEKKWKMEFHPGKCQLLRITNKSKHYIQADYFIHNTKIKLEESAKYLGISIDSKLKWKPQYNSLCKKANGVLAFLRRNFHSCPTQIKNNCYKTLVRPILDYGGTVWDPHYMKDKEKIEKIQKRAARFVTNNYRFESGNTKINMQNLNWEPLEERRAKAKVTSLFKARLGLVDIPLNNLNINNRSGGKGYQNYIIPSSNVDSHMHSYYPSTTRLWNMLPQDIRNSENQNIFIGKLNYITLRQS